MRIKDFVLCFIGWLCFSSAVASLLSATYRHATGGFLGAAGEIPIGCVVALFFTIWWFLVVKRK